MGYNGDRQVQHFHWAQFWSSAQEALYEGAYGHICFLHQHLKETVEYKLLGMLTRVKFVLIVFYLEEEISRIESHND